MFSQQYIEKIEDKIGQDNKVVVGVGDMKISKDVTKTIVTYSLGSCIGITIYDPIKKVAGMLHYMLPSSEVDRNRKCVRKLMFADTGIPLLFEEAYRMGADKRRLIVKIAGGGNIMDMCGVFSIGVKNYSAAKDILCRHNITAKKESVGGRSSRTLYLNVSSGDVLLKFSGNKNMLLF